MLKGIYVLHFSSLVYRYSLTNCVPILDFVLMGLSVWGYERLFLFLFLIWFLYSQQPLYLIQNFNLCSKIIETKVEAKSGKELAVGEDVLCTACEMTAIWIHTQLKQNKTKAKIFEYVYKVIFPYILFWLSQWINHWFLHNWANILCTFLLLLKLCDNLQNPMAESAVNCDNIVNMPYISFIIGNRSFHLTPEQVWVFLQPLP